MARRTLLSDYALANPLYIGGTLTFYTVDSNGDKTATLATLYAEETGSDPDDQLSNPQVLDSVGKLKQPVYFEDAMIGEVAGVAVPSHDTGIIYPVGDNRGAWATATLYHAGDIVRAGAAADGTNDLYIIDGRHTSGVFATDLGNLLLSQLLDVSLLVGLTTTPVITGADALKPIVVNAGATAYELVSLTAPFVDYKQDDAASVERTVHDKLGDIISVKDFGAVGDGVTEDAPAFQAAIDYFTDEVGGTLFIPAADVNYLISTTLLVAEKQGLRIIGERKPNGHENQFSELVWGGAAGGTVLQLDDPLQVELAYFDIDGDDIADYGLLINVTVALTGWGISNYTELGISSCNKNPMKFIGDASTDAGRNHFHRCSFRKVNASTATPVDDAAVAYDTVSNVQDVYEHCEFFHLASGVVVAGGYGIYIESITPRIHFRDCYDKAETGYGVASSGATPRLRLIDCYSESENFFEMPGSVNSQQYLIRCSHVVAGGASIVWAGSGTTGVPLTIDGGDYLGSVTITGSQSPVILNNNPTFSAAFTFPAIKNIIRLGRPGNGSTDTIAAINAPAFIPTGYANVGANINPDLAKGTVNRHTLSANTTVNAPVTLDAAFDIDREIELQITGGASAWTVTFNAIFLKAGGAYAHSGIGLLDIIRFRYDGTNWLEISRSMDVS